MAYQTYTTDAVVVGSEDRLTADRTYVLFTRDVGLIYARAVSVRREQSKLRYCLQDFSRTRVSLVRGKQGWRIVGAEDGINFYFDAHDRHARGALLHVFKLLRRLVRGEEAHRALYDTFVRDVSALCAARSADADRAAQMALLRMLALLGYVAPNAAYAHTLEAETLGDALHAAQGAAERTHTRAAIDRALSVSHL